MKVKTEYLIKSWFLLNCFLMFSYFLKLAVVSIFLVGFGLGMSWQFYWFKRGLK